ncbi:MAG: hypothetical protein MUC74_14900 [Ideonella sp.]|jgi:hypothetical protein|nr:hypothetical protein [Ideonella sp.]
MKHPTARRRASQASLMYWSGAQRLAALAVPLGLLWGAVAWATGGSA